MFKPPARPVKREKRPPADRLQPEQILHDRYRIVRLIGRGGMGEVYEAEDQTEGKLVAVKTVQAKFLGSDKVVARFAREIDLSNRISHPNVLRIYDVFDLPPNPTDPERRQSPAPCMVMELLSGETLADRLADGRLVSEEEAEGLLRQVAHALVAAHEARVVHRDLKPDNIFLVPEEDGSTRVVLTDFGVARPSNASEQDDSFTATDVIVGTPTYMAPEQLELEEAIPASDIYTIGLVVYEMLTGKFPFEGDTAIQVVFKRVQQDPIPPSRFKPDIDEGWEELILSCLARNPDDRMGSAEAMLAFLDRMGQPEEEQETKRRWWPF